MVFVAKGKIIKVTGMGGGRVICKMHEGLFKVRDIELHDVDTAYGFWDDVVEKISGKKPLRIGKTPTKKAHLELLEKQRLTGRTIEIIIK